MNIRTRIACAVIAVIVLAIDPKSAESQFFPPGSNSDDLMKKIDSTRATCTSSNDAYECHVDWITDAKGDVIDRLRLPMGQRQALDLFEFAYSKAVNELATHPYRSCIINLLDPAGRIRTATVTAGEVAKALTERRFVAELDVDGGAQTLGNTTKVERSLIYGYGAAQGVPRGQPELLREVGIVHEGMHGDGTDTDAYLAPGGTLEMGNPYYDAAHQRPYNEAALILLGNAECLTMRNSQHAG